uniref:Uncharacterized protein n=1 Tax=Candidatus Kentrum sp. SD TaxID=2126332 RepID=A0A450YPV8_9GAMM|nr:MAG: hypothetical protein BECKSD772F_GA0070984_11507 [Candidatus Kentron sp. SD]VFK49047.1 MAG: hypothetical protein BECKSD772E_GA0070983_11557 [Candidatus Kentron sp. SD]
MAGKTRNSRVVLQRIFALPQLEHAPEITTPLELFSEMIINELLVDKYRVRKTLDERVGHSLEGYVKETHNRVLQLSKTHGLNFRYGIPGVITEDKKQEEQDYVRGCFQFSLGAPHSSAAWDVPFDENRVEPVS